MIVNSAYRPIVASVSKVRLASDNGTIINAPQPGFATKRAVADGKLLEAAVLATMLEY